MCVSMCACVRASVCACVAPVYMFVCAYVCSIVYLISRLSVHGCVRIEISMSIILIWCLIMVQGGNYNGFPIHLLHYIQTDYLIIFSLVDRRCIISVGAVQPYLS